MFQCLDHFFYLYNMPLNRRLVGSDADILRIGKTIDDSVLHINGNINENRSFSSGIGNIKCFLENSRNILYVFYKIAVFHKGFHSAGNIRFLKYITAQKFTVDLSRNTDQRNTVCKSSGDSGNDIRSPRSACDRTHSGSARHSCHTACCVGRILFRTHQYRFDIGL